MGILSWLFGHNSKKEKHCEGCADIADILYEQGLSALHSFNYETAAFKFESAAEYGHDKAANNLGMLYMNGLGVPQDTERAIEFWKKSKCPDAYNNLGICYDQGNGVPVDKKKAREYYLLAIAGGNKDASNNLNALQGESMKPLSQKAADELIPLANAGSVKAQFFLAGCYYMGKGVPRDMNLAFQWMKKAAEAGEPNAQANLASMYRNGEGIKTDMKNAMKWLRKAADNNNPEALLNLGICYIKGDGVSIDFEKGLQYIDRAAAAGHAGARLILNQAKGM